MERAEELAIVYNLIKKNPDGLTTWEISRQAKLEGTRVAAMIAQLVIDLKIGTVMRGSMPFYVVKEGYKQ